MNNKIKDIFASILNINIESIDDFSSPDTVASWDSINHILLIIALEKEFNIRFDEYDIQNLLRFDKIKRTVQVKIDNKPELTIS